MTLYKFADYIAKHSEVQQQSTITFNNKRELKHGTVQHTPTQQHSTLMLWDGNRQAQEYTDTYIFTTVYEQNSFVPVARLVWLRDELLESANDEIIKAERESWEDEPKLIPNIQIYHYHNDHLGTPNELTSQDGEVVWLADYEAWGNTAKIVYKEVQLYNTVVSAEALQPLRFQGQYYDEETGLHYNRFRYFDPDLGMFVSRDPIGLMGGFNTFQYAPNPTGWVDPFGLWKKHKNNGQFAKKPGPKAKPTESTHGNSHDCCKDAYGYKLVDRDTGELLKYGETTNPNPKQRYSQTYYDTNNARMVVIKSGTKKEMHTWQHVKILEYKATHNGMRPPLNKSDY